MNFDRKPLSPPKPGTLEWLMLLYIGVFLFIVPFQTGLFNGYSTQYEKPIYTTILFVAFLMVLVSIYLFRRWQFEEQRDGFSLYIWFIPITFLLAVPQAATPHEAWNMVYIHLLYSALFITAAYLGRTRTGARFLQQGITLSGYVIVWVTFACAFGNLYIRDAIMLTDQGYRMTAVFQYANAYAALLLALLLCCLYYMTHSRKWYWIALNGFMLVPILLSFWLTLSRGGIVVLPFLFIAVLPILTLVRQLAITVYTLLGTLAALIISSKVTEQSTTIVNKVFETVSPDLKSAETISLFAKDSLIGWGTVLGVSLILAGLAVVLDRYVFQALDKKLQRFSDRKISKLVFPVSLVILGVLGAFLLLGTGLKTILPDNIQTRLDNLNFRQHSVLERFTFYKDSVKVFEESPLVGTGGGGWMALYEKFQNNPYTSRQAHNFFLQYLTEVGILGSIAFGVLLLAILGLYIRKLFTQSGKSDTEHFVFYFVAIAILIHSTLDFGMSYVYLGSLVFLSLGGIVSALSAPSKLAAKVKPLSSKWGFPSLVAVFTLVFLVVSFQNVKADQNFSKAIANAQQGKALNEIMTPLNQAIQTRPNHPQYAAVKAEILLQVYSQTQDESYWNEAEAVLREARKVEPTNRTLFERTYILYLYRGQMQEAAALMEEAMQQFVWEISFYERASSVYLNLWSKSLQVDDKEGTTKYMGRVRELYNTVVDKASYLSTLPEEQMQGRPFYLTPTIRYSVAHGDLIDGNVEKAYQELKIAAEEANQKIGSLINDQEIEHHRSIIRWYHAVSMKLERLDQGFYDQFINQYPGEQESIANTLALIP